MWLSFVFSPCNFFSFDSPLAKLILLVSPLECNEFALFKSVEQINRFKKQHFLNQFQQNNRFKKCTNGRVQKIQHC
jgi:hypothetical protein